MTRFVIDASPALFAISGPHGARVLTEHEAQAPPLLWSEVIAALRQRVFRREVSGQLADRSVAGLRDAPIHRFVHAELYEEAYAVAGQIGWAKTYDAKYVALARRLSCPLVTGDARLARGVAAIVDVMTLADLIQEYRT